MSELETLQSRYHILSGAVHSAFQVVFIMRSCQYCAVPIPTMEKVCANCGQTQKATVGGEAARQFPEIAMVAEENDAQDRKFSRTALVALLGISTLVSVVSGVALGELMLIGSLFIVVLLAIYILFQVIGIDVTP